LEANRLGLILNVREEGRAILLLQPHLDESPEDDLQAHRELERDRGLPCNDPSSVQGILREYEEDFRLIHEHPNLYNKYIIYLLYNLYRDTHGKSSEMR